jgi:hypothetical protein
MANALLSIEEEMAKEMETIKIAIKPNIKFRSISTKGRMFTASDDSFTPRQDLECIVLAYAYRNEYYTTAWSQGAGYIPPVCWAVGDKQNELKVNKSVENPEHIECDTCPQNEYPQGGGGKACKNTIKLAIIPPDFEEGDLPYLISFPPTANTPFREYMESVSKAGMHYMQNVTTISFDPKVAYAKPICTLGSKHARMKDILPARERGKEWVMREPFIPED